MTVTRAILWDFGNVIAFFDHLLICQQLADRIPRDVTAEDVYRFIFQSDLEERTDCGKITPEELIDELREFGVVGSDEDIVTAWSDMFQPNDAVIGIIPHLPRDIRVILASNTNALHHRHYRWQFADVFEHFDAEVVSYAPNVRCMKPAQRFYQACLEAAQCEPAECLYFDDRADLVDAARQLGIDGVVYHPRVNLEEELRQRGII